MTRRSTTSLQLGAALRRALPAFGVAACFVLGTQPGAAQSAPTAPATPKLTITGCVARNGDIELDKGTRDLDAPDTGFALTNARIVPPLAITGSTSNSGTIPSPSSGASQPPADDSDSTLNFSLAGDATSGVERYIGKRIEVLGTIDEAEAAQPGTAQPESAHPSAELRRLNVIAFKAAPGVCQS